MCLKIFFERINEFNVFWWGYGNVIYILDKVELNCRDFKGK